MGGLVPKFNIGSVKGRFVEFEKQVLSKQLQVLTYAGEQFVNIARNTRTYRDRTGNLRSSIGYVVGYEGKVVKSNFSGTGKEIKNAKNIANEVLQEYAKGYVLIGFAGMGYAASVESKGYDVITGSAPEQKKLIEDIMKAIKG